MTDESFKCVVVGEFLLKPSTVFSGAVGKTCLLLSYCQNQFPDSYVPTVFDNYSVNVVIESKVISLSLLDTAGQSDYDQLRPLSYPQTDVFLLCFAVNNENSLSNLEHKWYPEVRKACPNTPFIVVGTKSDFRLDHDESDKSDKQDHSEITLVDKAKGEEIAKKIGAKKYIETSAKKMKNVRKVFEEAVKAVLYKHVQTKMEDKHEAKKSGCCRVM